MIISQATPADAAHLLGIWEDAVRATHHFLSETALGQLTPVVRDLVAGAMPLHCLRDDSGVPYAFLGVADDMIEMLFVHPSRHGSGAGRALVRFAIDVLGARRVDVNEQNPRAAGFYRHLGFRQVGRSALDPFGNPYPLLHLELA